MNKQKRFYIGTMFEYQLAKQYIQEGKGCTIQACTRSFASCTVVRHLLHFLVQADADRPQQMDPV